MVDLRTMQNVKTLQNVGWDRPNTGIPDEVQDIVDKGVASGFKKVWHGILQVAASGFGKGVLIAGGLALAAGAAVFGMGALAGEITLANGIPMTVDTGVKIGFGKALSFITSGAGMVFLGAGGALGAVADTKKHQGRISADMARQEAEKLEKSRAAVKEKPLSLQRAEESIAQQSAIESKHPQLTNGRAAKSVANAFMAGDVQVEPSSFSRREEARKVARQVLGKAL